MSAARYDPKLCLDLARSMLFRHSPAASLARVVR